MIKSLRFRNKKFEFINQADYKYGRNAFTVIVGKNGTGKSTLLSTIVLHALTEYRNRFYSQTDLGFSFDTIEHLVSDDPSNIIAVSSSPFDKFPITKKQNDIGHYSYLGLRDGYAMNLGLSYMSKIFSSLVDSIYENHSHWNSLADVLNYLGYNKEILATLSFNYGRELLDELSAQISGTVKTVLIPSQGNKKLNRQFFIDTSGNIDSQKVTYIKEILSKIFSNKRFSLKRNIALVINHNGVLPGKQEYELTGQEITSLISAGILSLKDINLFKEGTLTPFAIKDSSSGELSVILSILGIASRIKNNSIICIDEPEVCLHPEWQEKYIQILVNTFHRFTGCHFIIATHSPQIIANLDNQNCYVVSMETAKVKSAASLINKSVDFQLAQVFKSPGFKNEYLSRIALNLFVKIGKNKQFDEEDLSNYKILKTASKLLENDDPVKEIILVIFTLYKRYA